MPRSGYCLILPRRAREVVQRDVEYAVEVWGKYNPTLGLWCDGILNEEKLLEYLSGVASNKYNQNKTNPAAARKPCTMESDEIDSNKE